MAMTTDEQDHRDGSFDETTTTTTTASSSHLEDSRPSEKRRKPPHVRSRASRACDTCKGRKTRCSGKYPCAHCSRLGLNCRYTASYRRGRLPSIEMETGEHELHPGPASPEAARRRPSIYTGGTQPAQSARGGGDRGNSIGSNMGAMPMPSPVSIAAAATTTTAGTGTGSSSSNNKTLVPPDNNGHGVSAAQSSRNSPEPAQTDRQGHYVGPSSGASFLLRVQRKLKQHPSAFSSDTSIFTFGDLPLPEADPRALILPPRAEAEGLVVRYFDFAAATHRFVHRPTIEVWLRELYETNGAMRDQTTANSRAALLFMVFATASSYPSSGSGKVDPSMSARFFTAAENQLTGEKGGIRLTSVQARLMQCFFLLSHSRINHCWSLFGTTAHLMLALGIHRRSRVDSMRNPDSVDIECRKRTFWCAYNMDTYLSAALGRPKTFHDDDIDQELPLCVNDNQLGHGLMPPVASASRQSIVSGMVAHIKLSRIVAHVLRDLYSIRPPSTANQFKLAAKYAKEIDDWRADISSLIDTEGVDPSFFQPIFLRQQNVLNFACWHAQILVHRPFLLNNFANLANLGSTRHRRTQGDATDDHVQRCVEAAMSIVKRVDKLSSNGQLYNTFWFTHYFAFCAVVMLYVYAIQQRHSPIETYLPAFQAATKCQAQTTSIAIPGSLAHRYGVVLQELRLELLRQNSQLLTLATGNHERDQGSSLLLEGDEMVLGPFNEAEMLPLPGPDMPVAHGPGHANNSLMLGDENLGFAQESPGSSVMQMAGWDQFESLVSGGLGRLDSFLGETENMEDWNIAMTDGLGG